MDVFLLPVGPDRYELYCEVTDEPQAEDPDESGGDTPDGERGWFSPRRWTRSLKRRFRHMLAEAERERRQGRSTQQPPPGWLGRLRIRMMRWVAESIAEQRLLWTLRHASSATFHFPADLAAPAAQARLRKHLGRDFDKHQFWLVIDSLLFIASGLLMIIPGPNLVAYYFAFRMVGHFLSLRGARHGLSGVTWTHLPSAPLAELRLAATLEPPARDAHVDAIAAALGLEDLPRFFHRTANVS
jgi:hypothetical protein